MFKCNFKAYEGDEKYIFVSYSHADADIVYPIIERLNEEGYRVWYDDGIVPGSEWPENIAAHLDKCTTFIFFASPNSVASDNCKREVNFALSRKKNFFTISLVPTQLSLGLELQISTQQNILFYEYKDIVKFYDTLFFATSLAECKRCTDKNIPDVKEAESEASNEKESSNKSANSNKQKKFLFIGFGAAMAIIAAIVIIAVCSSSTIKFDDYTQYAPTETYAYFSNKDIDSKFMKKLSRMKLVECLTFERCRFSSDVDLSDLKCLSKIDTFTVVDCNLPDYSFLEKMTSLETLGIDNASLTGLNDIPSKNLMYVNLSNVEDVPLSAFSSSDSLYRLDLVGCSLRPDSFKPLSSELTVLIISDCGLTETDFLKDSNLSNLNYICLSNNNISEVGFITDSADSLFHLDLSGNPLSETSLKAVQHCAELQYLDMSGVPMEDLSIIGHMRNLEYLDLSSCGISDLSNGSLQTKSLLDLILADNEITSLAPLCELSHSESGLEIFNISHNPVTSYEGLPKKISFDYFFAYDTNISEGDAFEYLSGCSFNNLITNYFDGIEKIDVVNTLVAVDCPAGKAGVVEESNCMFVKTSMSSAAMDETIAENAYNVLD